MPRLVANPPNPWSTTHVDLLEPAEDSESFQVYEETAKTVLSRNQSEDLAFEWSLNPYRGCFHACAYCYARRTHEYLDWGAGTDFDRRIVVKTNAAERLREALARKSWRRQTIAFSGVTDCYQPIEASYGLTRQCLIACAEFRNPVGIITKGALIERDLDVFERMRTEGTDVAVAISVPFADEHDGKAIEPFASRPARRFETIRRLSEAGVQTSVAVAPMIPGLNDHQIPEILERAQAAGATYASMTLLRLPGAVQGVFTERLRAAFPERADKVLNALAETRAGADNLQESRFGNRMVGSGPRWDLSQQLFTMHTNRLGIAIHQGGVRDPQLDGTPAGSPNENGPAQGTLFDS